MKQNKILLTVPVLCISIFLVFPSLVLAKGGANAPKIISVEIDTQTGDMFIFGSRLWTEPCPEVSVGGIEIKSPDVKCSEGDDPEHQMIAVMVPAPLNDGSHALLVAGDNGTEQFEIHLGKGGCSISGTTVTCDDGTSANVKGDTGATGSDGDDCIITGTTVTCGATSAEVKGPKGEKGDIGETGADGGGITGPEVPVNVIAGLYTKEFTCGNDSLCDDIEDDFLVDVVSVGIQCDAPFDVILNVSCFPNAPLLTGQRVIREQIRHEGLAPGFSQHGRCLFDNVRTNEVAKIQILCLAQVP